ncbi:MAG: 1,3-beta-galactosyl-N-acetylhexosamine phosphorylase [Christensenellaceae bacterium]
MKQGRLTIPTDANYVEGTKKFIERWGADAVRDCDGTELPVGVSKLAKKVYKTYFVVRGDNDFAYKSDEYMQNIALITDRKTAVGNELTIDLLNGFFDRQIKVNPYCYKRFWQVFDRTEGKEMHDWEYLGNNVVLVKNTKPMHEYTVNFFGYNLWDATQIYNYTANGWTKTKDRDYDPIYPEVFDKIKNDLKKWLKENDEVSVVRFTTFFYHFFLLYFTGRKGKLFDWYNYAMSASPAMFELFKKTYGYDITLEDIVTEGYYSNHFLIPSKQYSDYTDLVQKFVSEKAAELIELVHASGKEAMMFWGDNWIGAEPYGKYFPLMKLDAVVGSVSSGCTVRAVSDIENVKYREIRLMPYFFPDTLNDDTVATNALLNNWITERRALMCKLVDRIGFGGYLSLASKLPKFCENVEKVCDEFRAIYGVVSKGEQYTFLKVAILSFWGKEKSWMTYMMCQDSPYQRTAPFLGILEILAGLPVQIDFIGFEEAENGALKNYDVVFNCGDANTSFSGGECWKNPRLTESVRSYVYGGGAFIGVGEPSATAFQGKYFQLSDVLGVDREMGFSLAFHKYNTIAVKNDFIMHDVKEPIDYANDLRHVYANDGAKVLDIAFEKNFESGVNCGHIRFATNEFGSGRAVYLAGLRYNSQNARTLYRTMLWAAHKENMLKKAFCDNVYTECHYYPLQKKYAIVNNSNQEQCTAFYDFAGNREEVVVEPRALLWIER